MKWKQESIGTVAPSKISNQHFNPQDNIWHLNLDQIESDTGNIINKLLAPASDAGGSTYIFDTENVLYSKLRPYLNKVVCPEEPGIATSELIPLKPNSSILNRKYFSYYLRSREFLNYAKIIVAGAKMPRIIMSKFWEHKIPLPPLSEQGRIVEILDQANTLRKNRAEADAKIERILPAIFYKMFGDPATNPKGWKRKRLGHPQVATINPIFSDKSISDDTVFSFVPMADVDEMWGRIIGKQVRPYSEVSQGFTPFQNNDVLFAKITPCMQNGKASIARNLINDHGFGSTEFHVLRAGPAATPEWLFSLVRLTWFRKQAAASFTGTVGHQRVPTDFLHKYEVPCPPIKLQLMFAKAVVKLLKQVDQVETSKNAINKLFNILIHRAFSGELTAKWRETRMKELLVEMEEQSKLLEITNA